MQVSTLKFILLLFSLFYFLNISQAQKLECGTVLPPDFESPKTKYPEQYKNFVKDFKENYLNRPPTAGSCVSDAPIKVHIIRRTNGTGGLTVTELETALTTLNLRYVDICLRFYVCGAINYIDDDEYFDFDTSEETALTSANNVANVINIYFANSVGSGASAYCGYAYFPGGPDVIMMDNSCALNGSTLPHEVGHFFGLPHTHNGGTELVNGTNCLIAGDFYCDTPADPTLSSSNVNSSCVYTGTATDANGDLYIPDPLNIMSYSRKACRTVFSLDQKADVAFHYNFNRNYWACPDYGVNFTADVTQSCAAPLTVNFTETAVGESSYEWDFDNDGTVDATIANPSYTFTAAGAYEVNLTVSDGTDNIAKVKPYFILIGTETYQYSNNFDAFFAHYFSVGYEETAWETIPTNTDEQYRWNTNNGSTISTNTGPEVDQSLGNANGIYFYTESSQGNTGDIAELITPCLDIPTGATDPYVSFFYHMYGSSMGTLHVDLHDGTNWINDITTAISGQQQSSSSDAWIEKTFDITPYKGSTIKIRFRGERGTSFRSDMAIDNFQLLEVTPLPVELVKFEGQSNSNGENILSWQTASEENAAHFLLEHSEDGVKFETLAKISAAGNSNYPSDYRYTHFHPANPDNYYRLKMIDFDETFEYSDIVYLPFSKQVLGVTIFPNPSNGIFQFERPANNNSWDLNIYNSIGQLVKTATWQDKEPFHQLDLQYFPDGIYTVQIVNRNEIIETKRLIKI